MAKKTKRKTRTTKTKADRSWAPKVLYAASSLDVGHSNETDGDPWPVTYQTVNDASGESNENVYAEYELKRFVTISKKESFNVTEVK